MQDQQKVWDNIAPEWNKFKTPGHKTLEFVKKQKGKILDLGSGSGRYLIKKTGLKFYLLDFSKEMIKLAKQKAKKLKIKDAEFHIEETHKLPFKDDFFDSAIYADTLHCVETKPKRKKSLKELYRVLKPKAKAKISVWNKNQKRFKNSPKQRITNWRNKGGRFYYLYDSEELYKEVEQAGFKILEKPESFREISIIVQKPKG